MNGNEVTVQMVDEDGNVLSSAVVDLTVDPSGSQAQNPLVDDLHHRTAFALFKGVDSPISLGLWLRMKYGEYEALARYKLPIGEYADVLIAVNPRQPVASERPFNDGRRLAAEKFALDYQAACFVAKAKFLPTGIDLEAAAIAGFTAGEESNLETNELVRARNAGEVTFTPRVERAIQRAQRKLATLVESWSSFDWQDELRFGKGSTASLPRSRANWIAKTMSVCDVTPSARQWVLRSLSEDADRFAAVACTARPEGPWCATRLVLDEFIPRLTLRQGRPLPSYDEQGGMVGSFRWVPPGPDVIDFADKNAVTKRTIIKQPSFNVEVQLAWGMFLRRALNVIARIDLNSQSHNQEAARRAIDDNLATLDLVNASNRIASEVVRMLFALAPNFLEVLESLRTREAYVNGRSHRYEMFSAMGNGFTFELETALFWALSSSVDSAHGGVLVYGDDIVVPQDTVEEVIEVLGAVGFEVHPSKSFVCGPFYESCGKHYFNGFDVTPAYQKEAFIDTALERHRAHNRLIRAAARLGNQFAAASSGSDLHGGSEGSPGLKTGVYDAVTLHHAYYSACATIYRDSVSIVEPTGNPPRKRVYVMPLSRRYGYAGPIAPLMDYALEGERHGDAIRYDSLRRLYGRNPARGYLYESDAGFAVTLQMVWRILAAGSARGVRCKERADGFVTCLGLKEIPIVRKDVLLRDDSKALYAYSIRKADGSEVTQTVWMNGDTAPQPDEVRYRDGWGDGDWQQFLSQA